MVPRLRGVASDYRPAVRGIIEWPTANTFGALKGMSNTPRFPPGILKPPPHAPCKFFMKGDTRDFPSGKTLSALGARSIEFDQVIDTLRDERQCCEITERAFAEIIHEPRYSCEAFVAKVDAALDAALARKGHILRGARPPVNALPRVLILTACDPVLDPRTNSLAKSLAQDHEVCEIGTYRFGVDGGGPSLERPAERWLRVRVEPSRHGAYWLPDLDAAGPHARSAGASFFIWLF